MNGLVKGGLAIGGLIIGLGALRRALNPSPRYAPWEKPPYEEFEKKVLVLGGGFGGYTAAKDVCNLTRDREDVGVLITYDVRLREAAEIHDLPTAAPA